MHSRVAVNKYIQEVKSLGKLTDLVQEMVDLERDVNSRDIDADVAADVVENDLADDLAHAVKRGVIKSREKFEQAQKAILGFGRALLGANAPRELNFDSQFQNQLLRLASQGRPVTAREAILHLAREHRGARRDLLDVLHKFAGCSCGDEVIGMSDELFAGRAYTPRGGPSSKENKGGYGSAPTMGGPGKWKGKKKNKCYYETGDPADRCYVTTNGGPGGQSKPETGSAGSNGSEQRKQYNKKYRKQRWGE